VTAVCYFGVNQISNTAKTVEAPLILQRKAELNDSRRSGIVDGGEEAGSVVEIEIGRAPAGMIEDVETFQLELQTARFIKGEILGQAHIPVLEARTTESADSFIAECPEWLQFESAGIEPVIQSTNLGWGGASRISCDGSGLKRIAHLIDALVVTANASLIAKQSYCKRRTGLKDGDSGELPSPKNRFGCSLRMLEEWKFPRVVEGEDVSTVEVGRTVLRFDVIAVLREAGYRGVGAGVVGERLGIRV